MSTRVIAADLADPLQAEHLVAMLEAFVRDPAVAGVPLPEDTRENVVEALRAHPTTRVWLAYDESQPIGFAIGIVGFSSFAARPVLNVHDLGVIASHRSRGVAVALLQAMEGHARERDCCKLTLEVREDNLRARAVYDAFGFGNFAPGVERVPTFFIEKKL